MALILAKEQSTDSKTMGLLVEKDAGGGPALPARERPAEQDGPGMARTGGVS